MEGLIFGILRYVKKKKQVKVTQHLANRFTADRSSEENEGLRFDRQPLDQFTVANLFHFC